MARRCNAALSCSRSADVVALAVTGGAGVERVRCGVTPRRALDGRCRPTLDCEGAGVRGAFESTVRVVEAGLGRLTVDGAAPEALSFVGFCSTLGTGA